FPGASHARDNQEGHLLTQKLAALKKQSPKALVVHLCGYARYQQGKLYLLPADADPVDPQTWLKMEDVLDAIHQCPAPRKLLILDITHPLDDPRQPAPPADIAARFEELFRSKKRDDLMVLCACSAGQVSLLPEELPLSAFGYYLDEGLRGHADGYKGDDKR